MLERLEAVAVWYVKGWASWSDVECGRLAHESRHAQRGEALETGAALALPIVDVGEVGGYIIGERMTAQHPATAGEPFEPRDTLRGR